MSYRLNGLLARDAEPYGHADRVAGSATIDVSPILKEELDRLGYPLPIGASPQSLDRRVRQLLDEAGIARFSEGDYRRMLRRAIAELSDSKDTTTMAEITEEDVVRAQREFSGKFELADAVSTKTHLRIVARLGTDDYSVDQYVAAAAAIEEEDAEPEGVAYPGDPGGEALHLAALKILAGRQNWDYDSEDYLRAIDEAARVLSIDLSGRR